MIQRKTYPAYGGWNIAIATEQMSDGKWAVVVTLKQSTGSAERTVDLPVSHERFDSQADAEHEGVRMARAWIDENTPKEVGPPVSAGVRRPDEHV
ncbi:MAG TPA: hypothetical protein VFO18_00260 [Methylomirabilota bacterium]|nr:hypothetical protein [Methylomirabilota bacterium]